MEIILFLIGIIVGLVALGKAGQALKALQELRKQIDGWEERIGRLTGRIYRLEEREAPSPPAEEERPSPFVPLPVERGEPGEKPAQPIGEAEPAPPTPPLKREEPERTLEERPAFPAAEPAAPGPARRPVITKEATRAPRDTWAGFEEAVGKRWMTWVGVLVLFFSAGFFLKYAFDHDWIGPGTQVLIACAGGIALLGLGSRFLRKDMRALGQGLSGGGLMILYAALFAAFSPAVYGEAVIPRQELVFGLVCLVTVAGVTMAVRHDAISISFLAVLGGFLTPILVSTGANARDSLFSYVLLLDLGVIAVALYRRWRALDVLAFAGTTALFSGWFHDYYEPDAMLPTLLWLGAFFLVFLVLPFVNHLRRKTVVTVERFIMAIVNATFAFGFAYRILHGAHDPVLSWIALGMAAAYLAMGVLTRKRIPEDGRALFGFVALAMLFLTISVPLRLGLNGITLVWAGEAAVLLYLGYRFRYHPVRVGGFIVLLLAVGRVVGIHWERAEYAGPFTLILNRQFMMLMCAPIGAAVFAVIHQAWRREARADDRTLKLLSTIGAGLLALIFLHVELEQWLSYRAGAGGLDPGYLKGCALTLLWALGAAGFLAGGLGGRSTAVRCAGALPLLVAFVLGFSLYIDTVSHGYWVFLNGRFGADLLVCALLFAYGFAVRDRAARTASLAGAGYAALLLTHVEIYQWIWKMAPVRGWNAGYLCGWVPTILWSLGALLYLAAGAWKNSRGTRWAGLLPLAVAVVGGLLLYRMNAPEGYWIFANAKFIAASIIIVTAFLFAFSVRRLGPRAWAATAVGFAALFLLHVEIRTWIAIRSAQWTADCAYAAACILSLLWLLGSLAFLAGGIRSRSAVPRTAGLVALLLGFIYAVKLYGIDLSEYLPVLNARFLVGLAACGTLFAHTLVRRRIGDRLDVNERPLAALLFWCTIVAFLALFSTEPYLWYTKTVPDPDRAQWLAQMSVTIVWGVYASALLATGFRRRMRPMRLAALGLFFLAAAKLVLVDMEAVKQIYRIVSFFVLGVLMIGASYLYHRVEARMKEAGDENKGGV